MFGGPVQDMVNQLRYNRSMLTSARGRIAHVRSVYSGAIAIRTASGGGKTMTRK